ncbi:MAG: excinuclease ABC subunit C [Saprospiraceae bacterium]|nr:excinuclease ABC subunit C [Saprospiraceae bacterium]
MTKEDFLSVVDTIPGQPGVYQFIDKKEKVLNVGKAKNLKNRVSSYFNSDKQQMNKTRVMLKHAVRVDFTLVDSEADAFLLENTLIKRFQPRYNVNLKDGKSYTYLCIKNEPYPRVFFTRRLIKDGSTYFGPYTSKWRAKVLLDLIKDLFPLRTCNYHLSPENIASGKFKVCLEYHIKNCFGPCVGLEPESEYLDRIDQVKNILKGHFKPVKDHLFEQMNKAAGELDFERAQQWKNKMVAFEDYQGKSTVVNINLRDIDVFSVDIDREDGLIYYMKVVNGAVINTYVAELTLKIAEEPEDLLSYAIPRIREKFGSITKEIIVPLPVDLADPSLIITVPQRGDKYRLLELSDKNLALHKLQKRREEMNKKGRVTHAERIIRTLAQDLQMEDLPYHIECFDNSNIQGAYPVASCVVFRNAKPAKKDYRHYNIKTVEGPNDFASMEEVVFRRYRRMLEEGESLPQLVIIDGGKGQLGSAMKSLKTLGLEQKMTVVGIAKRLEEIFFPGDSIPLHINKKSESLKLIQQLRNEAHRFAITFHRQKRSQKFTATELTDIKGIGHKTADKLLLHFKSVKRLREANREEIEELVGKAATKAVLNHFSVDPFRGVKDEEE